ncbi:MAG: hypothetical protein CFE23_07175 [Flavobacterium sp. BFFFF1]|uniref:beta strand repeat-containing protein n=1 Tax=Flavobacterium sp. BFFFF1 TaxID=2015557 RepID=UPI000BD08C44|nr:hypothetical protein [Flavobacterium sp. BFFFF1]OYU80753.1 MAG: hypothetical protein CFE23_07175 [Flavobacterium sp. BFFFF1]
MTINLSANLSSGEYAYLRYSTDNFATSNVVAIPTSGTAGFATIPGSANLQGANVAYYVFTSNQSTAPTHTTADYFTLNSYNSGGQNVNAANFTYTVSNPSPTYVWNKTGTADWTIPTNWTPSRTIVGTADLLVFNNGATCSVSSVASETIAGLSVASNTNVTFTSGANLTISNGVNGADFTVDASSQWNVLTTSTFKLILASGATGSVSGAINFKGNGIDTDQSITPTDANSLTFNNGSTFTQDLNSTGNAFGSTGTANAVVFSNGATFIQKAGSNPFALQAPSSRVVFNPGSLFNLAVAQAPSFAGRTYGNFQYTGTGTASVSGGSSFTVYDLTVSASTLTFDVTAGGNIKGNITVVSGATLNMTSTSPPFNLNGSAPQTITVNGTMRLPSGSPMTVASGSTVNLTPGTAIIGDGIFNVASGATLGIGSTAGISSSGNSGNIQTTNRNFSTGANYVYNGSANQITGTGLPATVSNLAINNSGASGANTVTLTNAVTSSTLALTAGQLELNNKILTVASGGSVTAASGNFMATPGRVNFAGTGTVSGTVNFPDVTLAGGVNFGPASNINGSLQINSGGFVNTNAPTFGSASTLIYNTGGVYARGNEWSAGSGKGYPNHVQLSNATTLDPGGTTATGTVFTMAGNLTVGAGSSLYMDYSGHNMTVPLTINGDLNLNGNLSASGVNGGDVIIKGNWNRVGSFAPNNRAVFFQGSNAQTMTGITTFDYVLIDKSGGNLTLANNMVCNKTLSFTASNVANINTANNTVQINPSGNVNRLSGWVNGNLIST